ncbi:MAG: [ribosomal protein S5]-alanine N-acetyltransferase [Frankiaceae bacterium]|nr:[ribosomal protein S5]-alanine N-acetyltransferase [Frankiaceae bacterium]
MDSTPGWPAELVDGPVTLRGLRSRDGAAWVRVRRQNIDWLLPWEASAPGAPARVPTSMATFIVMWRRLRHEGRHGRCLPFAIFYQGEFVGQLTVGGVTRGSLQGAHLGYWIDRRVAGRGIMPTAVALATDHAFWSVGLHRVEVNIRPENVASRRVVEKLGFREEGLRRAFLHIGGEWRDHLSFALTADEVPAGLLSRWHRMQRQR